MRRGFGFHDRHSPFRFDPATLFIGGSVQGTLYDPSDSATLFQDNGGTTPVTASGQSVGLMLDKSKNGVGTNGAYCWNLSFQTNFASITGTAGQQIPNGTGWSHYFNTGGTRTYVASSVISGAQAMDIAGVTSARNFIAWSFTPKASTTYTVSFYIESVSGVTGVVSYAEGTLGTGGSSQILSAPTSTGRVSYTFTTGTGPGTVNVRLGIGTSGNASGSIRISGFQVNEGSTLLPYQPIAATWYATMPGNHAYQSASASRPVYTLASGLSYLALDGSNDSLLTDAIDFTGTNKMTVWAGVLKSSDAAQGVVAELSGTIASNNGAFLLSAPNSAAANYNWSSKGTTQVDNTVTTYTAPNTAVLTGQADIAAPSNIIRVNGAQAGSVATTQGTGNFGNYPLYIGRRNNASLPFNGRLYGLIVLGAAASDWQVYVTEQWMAGKTGLQF